MVRLCVQVWPLLTGLVLCIFLLSRSLERSAATSTGRHSPPNHYLEAHSETGDLNYGVIVDAGSSGSRAFVYVWPPHTGMAKELLKIRPLLDETNNPVVKKIAPGISTFGSNPDNATDYMKPLLDFAATHIPKEKHKETSLFIMATAGLRLIPTEQSGAIMKNLREGLPKLYSFIILDQHIEMITGKWEGIYSWIAVNYALGRFKHDGIRSDDEAPPVLIPASHSNQSIIRSATAGMIDMGGGSVQIAYEINQRVPRDQMHLTQKVNLGCQDHDAEHEYRLYVTTFLGYGANSALERYEAQLAREAHQISLSTKRSETKERRLNLNASALQPPPISADDNSVIDTQKTIQKRDLGSNQQEEQPSSKTPIVRDPCLPVGLIKTVHLPTSAPLSNTHPTTSYTRKGVGEWKECLDSLEGLLRKNKVCNPSPCSMNGVYQPPINYTSTQFFGFSEYWYSMEDVFSLGGPYNYTALQDTASEFCKMRWSQLQRRHRQKLYPKADNFRMRTECFKSAWVVSVLHKGFGFPRDTKQFKSINLINGQEVQWTLGAILYKLRYFPLREVQRLRELHHINASGNHWAYHYMPSGYFSQFMLLTCMIVVVLAAVRYFVFLRPIKAFKQTKGILPRNRSMMGYMMVDQDERCLDGVRIEQSDYVY